MFGRRRPIPELTSGNFMQRQFGERVAMNSPIQGSAADIMKIAMIHGQNHRGSTYHIGAMLAEKLGGEVTEFFLPRDFGEFCVGCNSCFMKAKEKCPHYEKLIPINKAIKEADVIILTSPVYVYHVTGPMKAWLDHYGHQWMVHRPDERMFTKQAVCISTAAGKRNQLIRIWQTVSGGGVSERFINMERIFTQFPIRRSVRR